MNINILITSLQWIFLIYIGLSSFYVLFFGTASIFYKQPEDVENDKKRKFLVLIPAYKEDVVIVPVVKDALLQNYPKELYDVIVIADSLQQDTIKELKSIPPVGVIEVKFDLSTKAKSINKALEMVEDNYDAIIVLDADNLMETSFISKVNDDMNRGYKAIQGHRVAKNKNTSLAILDGISEEINNSIFRKGHVVFGLSSALIGSGMAFEYNLYKELMADIDSFAEDKELEFKLFQQHQNISFLNDAYVFDEKISKANAFVDQRSRWIAYQLIYAKRFFFPAIWAFLTKANFDYLDKVLQQLLPPRILLLGLTFTIGTLSTIFNEGFLWDAWIVCVLMVFVGILISIPKHLYNLKTFKALMDLPLGLFLMILSIFRFKHARKHFNPTPHTEISTDKNIHN
jgi:cellulose synthase/poly-beta-1,6-N-acetylglucosamine synthase-like glycosyltransferase